MEAHTPGHETTREMFYYISVICLYIHLKYDNPLYM